VRSLGRNSRRAYFAAFRAVLGFDVRAALARVRCPTLVVPRRRRDGGARSQGDAGAGDPRLALVIVPGSGHATNADHADAFNATLRDFLAAR